MAKILVVDDEPSVLMLMRFALERVGHEVSEAGNGVEALSALGIDPANDSAPLPDLVILDVMMPIMDGLTTAKRMLQSPRAAKIKILVVTAKGDMRQLFESMPHVAGFFQKPFDPKILRETIAKLTTPQ